MRRGDWLERLEAYIAERMTEPFAWGRHDCCRFAAGAVEVMTGEDPMRGFQYENEADARRLLNSAGSLYTLLVQVIGPPMPVAHARRGDVVLAELELGPTVGVCLGSIVAFPAALGLTHRPALDCRYAWRVG